MRIVEDVVGLDGVLDRDPEQGPVLGIHGRLPELLGGHLAQALVALDGDALLALLVEVVEELGLVLDDDGLAVGEDLVGRRELLELLVDLEQGLVFDRVDQVAG